MKLRLVGLGALSLMVASGFGQTLNASYSASGNVGGAISAFAQDGEASASGSVSVAGMTGQSTVLKAYLYTNSWFSPTTMSATFNGNSLAPANPFDNQAGSFGYRWDVTSMITGNGSYSVNVQGGNSIYGAALAYVYSDASLAQGSVTLIDGAADNSGFNSITGTFNSASAGTGKLSVFTEADDAFISGEELKFNGTTVGGPFDANLGNYASLVSASVAVNAGANGMEITTIGDQFAAHVAMLTTNAAVPEPASMAALGLGIAALIRRRKNA